MSKPNNPPAFPSLDNNDYAGQIKLFSEGMTLRDYFAAKAVSGIMCQAKPTSDYHFRNIAEDAYKVADEMLKQREQ